LRKDRGRFTSVEHITRFKLVKIEKSHNIKMNLFSIK